MVSPVRLLAVIIALSGVCVLKVEAQSVPSTNQSILDKRAKIRFILETTNTGAIANMMLEAKLPRVIAGIRARNPNITTDQMDEFVSVYRKHVESHLHDFDSIVIQAWDKFFSDDDVDAYYQFVASPAGKLFLSKLAGEQRAALDMVKTYVATVLGPELEALVKANPKLTGLNLY